MQKADIWLFPYNAYQLGYDAILPPTDFSHKQ